MVALVCSVISGGWMLYMKCAGCYMDFCWNMDMMKGRVRFVLAPVLVFVVAIVGCFVAGCDSGAVLPHGQANTVYYWRTVFSLDSAETDFLSRHDISRIYIRFFDVVVNASSSGEDVIPNASIVFNDSVPVREVVPTVYITLDALCKIAGNERMWAEKIVTRIDNMCQYNNLGHLRELQLDCDWTTSTGRAFFNLCREVKMAMRAVDSSSILSSTIRLHQLSGDAPPVDYGVLMLYNTGSFKNPDVDNSILSLSDVEPYINDLPSYPLPLDFAYPVYKWNLLFRNNKFEGLLRADIVAGQNIRNVGEGRLMVMSDTVLGDYALRRGDILRQESSPFEVLKSVKSLINRNAPSTGHSSVLYHLSSGNLSEYTSGQIDSLYQ